MRQVVYSASPESHQIYCWQLHINGELTLLDAINVEGQVQPIVINPHKGFLYAGIRPNFRVLIYRIINNGTLVLVGESPLPGSPTHISIDHQSNYFFCSSYNQSCISISHINNQGLIKSPHQIIHEIHGCHSANIDIDNQILFVPALKQDRIYLFKVNLNGTLSQLNQKYLNTVKGAGPRHMAFHPNGNYAYCVNELNGSISVWGLKKTNKEIEYLNCFNIMPKDIKNKICWSADINITPDGSFLYACDRITNILTIFRVIENGASLEIKGFQPTEKQPRSFSIDNTGKYLIAAGQKSHHITVYKIQKQGLLTPLMQYASGQGPMWVVIHKLD